MKFTGYPVAKFHMQSVQEKIKSIVIDVYDEPRNSYIERVINLKNFNIPDSKEGDIKNARPFHLHHFINMPPNLSIPDPNQSNTSN